MEIAKKILTTIPCIAALAATASDAAAAHWGALAEPLCNRSIWWDWGLLAFGILTVNAENRLSGKLGDRSAYLLGKARKVGRAVRAASLIGWVSIVWEVGLITADRHYCRYEYGPAEPYVLAEAAMDIAALALVAASFLGATWLSSELLARFYCKMAKWEAKKATEREEKEGVDN